jgi:hypothetical protein
MDVEKLGEGTDRSTKYTVTHRMVEELRQTQKLEIE